MDASAVQAVRIIRLPQVKVRTGLSRSTIYLRIGNGTFPKPVNLGERAVGWVETEVDAWVAERVASRTNTATHTSVVAIKPATCL